MHWISGNNITAIITKIRSTTIVTAVLAITIARFVALSLSVVSVVTVVLILLGVIVAVVGGFIVCFSHNVLTTQSSFDLHSLVLLLKWNIQGFLKTMVVFPLISLQWL